MYHSLYSHALIAIHSRSFSIAMNELNVYMHNNDDSESEDFDKFEYDFEFNIF